MAKYTGNSQYQHDSRACIGVLITNLGTPAAPTAAALRRYLAEFLADPRVIEVPRAIWFFILYAAILPFRPKRSAEAYAKIWQQDGSPLLTITKTQAAALQAQLGADVRVEYAMRYGQPSIRHGLEELRDAGTRQLLILPLYPQYAAATTASTFDAVAAVLKTWRWLPEVRFVNHYHDDANYIAALAGSIQQHQTEHGRPDKLVFSFHGIPKHYFEAGDPYFCECHKTARLVAESLRLDADHWMVTFQSRFGPREWLQPYTDETLKELAGQGVQHVQVVCPGFAADCLETLEEIDMQNRAFFTEAGGQTFSYIPALNNDAKHIQALADLVHRHIAGWQSADTNELLQSRERAIALGANQ